jgi:hypothetical protein
MTSQIPLPKTGHRVPVIAAGSGPRLARRGLLSYYQLAYNNVFPSLVLFPHHFEYRVILKSSKKYSEIQEVWTRPHLPNLSLGDYHQLCIAFKGSWWGIFLVLEESILKSTLSALEHLGVVIVSSN